MYNEITDKDGMLNSTPLCDFNVHTHKNWRPAPLKNYRSPVKTVNEKQDKIFNYTSIKITF